VVIRELEPVLEFRISALHKDREPTSLVCSDFIQHLKSCLHDFLKSSYPQGRETPTVLRGAQ
jgi:hypothetical protein